MVETLVGGFSRQCRVIGRRFASLCVIGLPRRVSGCVNETIWISYIKNEKFFLFDYMLTPETLPAQLKTSSREIACLYARIQWLEERLVAQMDHNEELMETLEKAQDDFHNEKTLLGYRCLALERKIAACNKDS